MGATPVYALPYQGINDSPNGPDLGQDLAEATEAVILARAAEIAALQAEVSYGEGGTYSTNRQNTVGTTTSGAATNTTLTGAGATACSLTFVAPLSGKVDIINTAQVSNSGAAITLCGFEVRTGAVVGSGTVFLASSIPNALYSSANTRASVVTEVSGLTPGATYNVQQTFFVTGNTGSYENKTLAVRPAA